MTFNKGDRVSTPYGSGTVAYQRMAPPDYRDAAAVAVVLDAKRGQLGYVGTVVRAADVVLEPMTDRHILGAEV